MPGSVRATAYAVWKTFAISLPTMVEGALGLVSTQACDQRLHGWSHGIVEEAQVRVSAFGLDQVPRDRACVLMSNHQSHLDIPILFSLWPGRLRMVAKAELFRVPVFGKALRAAGFVSVDRSGNRKKAESAMREAADALRSGTSVWIAPEGTRSPDGRMGRFKKGGFLMAQATGAPIVPIAIDGSRNILPKHAKVVQTGVPVRVTFCPPVAPAGRPLDALMAEVRAAIVPHVTGAGE